MFKYELRQLIWYMRDNQMHSASVLSRMRVDNCNEYEVQSTDDQPTQQQTFFNRFGPGRIMYATCHGIIAESHAFGSREDLVQHLLTA